MRILLINPSPRSIFLMPQKNVPLGLAYIAATLEKEGHSVRILDMNVQPQNFKDELKRYPDVIGITATTPLVKEAWRLVSKTKETINGPFVLGGPHPSVLPEESLKEGADIIVRQEGEETMKELCEALEKGRDLSSIRGISFKDDGKIVHNPPRPYIRDLDTIPFPALHLFEPLSNYVPPQPVIDRPGISCSIITSRGCPYGCNFCYKGTFGRVWRANSVEYIIELWRWLVDEFRVTVVGVQDDLFNLDPRRAEKTCNYLIHEKIDTAWMAVNGLRADRVDRKLLRKMKQAGCVRVGFGVESGSQRVVDSIGKGLSLEKVRAAFRLCREEHIETVGFFMVGNLGENRETMEATIKFAIELDPDYAQFTTAVPFPGTRLHSIIKKEGRFLIKDWEQYGQLQGTAYFEIGDLTKDLVEKMWKKAYRSFYLRPKILAKNIFKTKTWLNLLNVIRASTHYLG